MKNKIKIFSVSLIALVGLFAGVNFASAQTATVTTCSSATISGTITDTNGVSTGAWFEYGTNFSTVDSGSGSKTNTQYFNSPQTYTQTISGLNQNTTYYYSAVVSNIYGTAQGATLSFTTPSCNNNQPSSSVPTVSTNSASSVGQNSATLNGYVNANGSNVNAWFEYGTTQSYGYTTNSVNYGNTSTSISGSAYNLAQNTTYYYRAVAQNSQGTVYGSMLSFTTTGQTQTYGQSYVSTNAATGVSQNGATLNGYMTSNGTNTSTWFEWGTSYSLGNSTSYTNNGTGSTSFTSPLYNLNSNTTYYYRAAAQSSYGTVYGNIVSFTTGWQSTYVPTVTGVAPTVSTLLATELTGTTALLNGLVFASNNQNSNAWYEWGMTTGLGSRTPSIAVGSLPTVKHSDYLTGLVSGQTYYYRIVAQNTYGTQYGTIYSFVSKPATVVVNPAPTVVYKPVTTVVTQGGVTQSLVMLTIDGGSEMVVSGEKRTYHVKWKNISAQTLSNVVLRVTFPGAMNIDSATKGVYSSADNSVVLDLKTLAPSAEGETFIFTTVNRSLKAGETLVPTANMVFTTKNGVQGDAIAYVTHIGQVAQNALSANVFGSGDFAPTTLLGWMSLLVLVLLMVFLGSQLYGKYSD